MMRNLVTTDRVNRDLANFFGDFLSFPKFNINFDVDFLPRVNISDNPDNLTLTFELPGMEKGDIKVMVKDDVLTVSGERRIEREKKQDSYVRSEICSGSFSRSFTLPDAVDAAKISADYKNGLLEIILPKLEEKKPKEIKVKVS